jgi:hypothetical protein
MGLLDDAIREHLDLKRRRGADPSEIAREESEALGPVRRGEPAEVADADAALDRPYADEPAGGATDGNGDGAHDEPARAYDHFADDAPFEDEIVLEPPVRSEAPQTHPDPYAEREDESSTPPHGDPLAHQQTREFSSHELDEALGQHAEPARHEHDEPEPPRREPDPAPAAADPDADPADELEETPEFLQETPEHDRLWFEQKPPKDFDF